MYTGLLIEELLALVERAEQRTRSSRRNPDLAAEQPPEALWPAAWHRLEANSILAGVA